MAIRSGTHDPRRAIAAGRALRSQTQTELARALTRATETEWSRRMVAALEIGEKALRVDVLLAIARVQELPTSFYLEGPERVKGLYEKRELAIFNQPVPLAAGF